jgi:hypothetical protein
MPKTTDDPAHFIAIAKKHLKRVQEAWDDPTDWGDLATYGLYCLEALIRAAALKAGETPIRTHWGKADQAANLTKRYKLPDVADLLQDLNSIRKSEAYGDTDADVSDYDAEDIAKEIEDYFDKVKVFCQR